MMTHKEREVPGVVPVEWREYCYVSDDGCDKFVGKGLFDKLTSQIEPPIPKSGGVMTENCKLWLPSGELLHAISYKGDLDGWRMQIEQGAKILGLFIGKIISGRIVLSDARSYDLSDCTVEFY